MSPFVRVSGKALKVFLKTRPIYGMVKHKAMKKSAVMLPDIQEAYETLNAASPRPRSCKLPLNRDWCEVPEVDCSVIVPCYNVSNYVNDCIESVLGQHTSHTFEVVAIDDGSTDNTGSLLDAIAARDSRLRVIHQTNKGFSGARNTGISLARGKVIVFVDSDDVVVPNALDVMLRAYAEDVCDYVTANYSDMSENGSVVIPHRGKRTHGAPWARAYSREIWRRLDFPVGFWFEDTVQAYCIDTRFKENYVDQRLYRYRKNGEGITAKCARSKKGLDAFWIVDEMIHWCRELDIELNQKIFEQTLCQFGPMLYERTAALSEHERIALFKACCDFLKSIPEFSDRETNMGHIWHDLLKAFRTENYSLWSLCVRVL
ncbi:MAG: glycosyltransferase family 2 protein [Collinsella sp.]